ncbi:MAG: carbohydrate ABC transporter permease [Rectinema subterraneum]|jgi:multiple sugar transport system permease protein
MSIKRSLYSLERTKRRAGFLMVAPSIFILLVFVIYPIVNSFILSFYNWNLLKNTKYFVGIGNYLKAFSDERFWNALSNTIYFATAFVPLLIILSLALALMLNAEIPGAHVFQILFFLPAITSMAIVAIVWRFLLDGDIGFISIFLKHIGFKTADPLRDLKLAMPTIISISLWRWVGFNMVILLAGLKAIPSDYYEAASIDGAGSIRQFFSITLPLLLPNLSFVLLTNMISSFQVFDQVYVMTKGGPMFKTEVLVQYIYYQGFNIFDMGYASAIAFLLFILILAFSLFQLRSYMRAEKERGFAS